MVKFAKMKVKLRSATAIVISDCNKCVDNGSDQDYIEKKDAHPSNNSSMC